MLIRTILLALTGLATGMTVAAAVFAFVTMLEIIPRLSARTGTAKRIVFYESCVIWGGTVGSLINIYKIPLPIGFIGLCVFGLLSGIFVGCLAMALAELLRVIPVLSMRAKLTEGLPLLFIALALGKGLGSLYQLFFVGV